jgi:Protein of unknown function (DUF2950)
MRTQYKVPQNPNQRDGGAGMQRLSFTAASALPRYIVFLALAAIVAFSAGCQKSQQAAPTGPQTFASPDDASKAVYNAAKAGDTNALLKIFGPQSADLVVSGDPVQDQAGREKFTASYDEMHRWRKLADGGMVLSIGADNYPMPIPLLKNSAGQWYFDGVSAKDEVVARRIGDNELSTVGVLNAMADAQHEYFDDTHDGASIHQYAQKFVSDTGQHNGLYWNAPEDQPESPLGPLAANASAEGYGGKSASPQPFHGYFFRILTKQGEHAKGGAKDYIVNGHMTHGFAILAFPSEYRNSGVMSFLINQDGVVFQKDLGPQTADVAKSITEFNPDDTWSPVE